MNQSRLRERFKRWKEYLQIAAARVFPSWFVRFGIRLLKRKVVVAVACVVVASDGRILLQRHTYGKPVWRLPGGLREGRETVYMAAAREVWEEARCTIEPVAIVDAVESKHTFDIVILAKLIDAAPFKRSAEVAERAFLPFDAFPEIPLEQRHWIKHALQLHARLSTR